MNACCRLTVLVPGTLIRWVLEIGLHSNVMAEVGHFAYVIVIQTTCSRLVMYFIKLSLCIVRRMKLQAESSTSLGKMSFDERGKFFLT